MWAEDQLYSTCLFGGTHGTSSGYTSTWTATNGTFSWSVTNGNTNGSGNDGWDYVKFGRKNNASVGSVITSAAYTVPITKVTVSISTITTSKINSIKLYTKTATGSWSEAGSFTKSTGNQTVELASPAANLNYKVEFDCASGSSNGLIFVTEIKYYVEKVAITSISLPSTESVGVGGTVTLTPTIAPANYTSTVNWESDDESIATVSSAGVVTGVAAGTTKITAKSSDDATIKAECTVTVTAPIAVTGVSLNKTSLDMYFGDTETLSPTIAPATATNKDVSWESDKTSVAIVSSDGTVTAVGPGTCKITVTTDDGGFTATCDVTVTIASIDLSVPKVISNWEVVSGSGYYTSDTYLNIEGYTFKLLQCMKISSTLQVRASEGIVTSPTINSANGYTVIIETGSGSNASGVLTLQIGSGDEATVTGPSKTLIATTDAPSASFTIKNKSGKVMQVSKITIVPNTAVVQSYGWATYIAPAPIEFEANTAYVVTNVNSSTGAVTVKNVSSVPANTPVLLKGAGSKSITVLTEAPDAPETNLLEVYAGGSKGDQVPYVLAKNGEGAGFKKWTGSASTITGRVVLWLDSEISAAEAREFLSFSEDDTTGINAVENVEPATENAVIFNLSGQRVMNPGKGLYIVNGKKVIIK